MTKVILRTLISGIFIVFSLSPYAAVESSAGTKTLFDAVDEIVSKLSDVQLARQGDVVLVRPSGIYIGIGSLKGVQPGMLFEVIGKVTEIRHPDTNELLGTEKECIGEIKVVSVQEKLSVCEVVNTVEGKQISVKNDSGEVNRVIEKRNQKWKLAVLKFTGDVKADSAVRTLFLEELYGKIQSIEGYELQTGSSIGADLVLIGNMDKDGDLIKVKARLIDSASGATLADMKSEFSAQGMLAEDGIGGKRIRSANRFC